MKKTNKIIALVLAMVLAFSSVPLMASAAAIDDKVDTVEELIQGENLGNLVEWLLKNLNNRKEEVTGTVLRLVFMMVKDESLQAKIGSTDLMTATDAQLADILVAWLDANLPTWTAEITGQDWWGIVTGAAKLLRVDIDLKTVRGAIGTLSDLCRVVNNNIIFDFGDLEKLSNSTIKNVGKKTSSLDVVYALFSWLSDDGTIHVVKKALKGELNLGGTVEGLAKGTSDDINNMVKDMISDEAIKEMLCDAIELDYEAYKSYTADELVAVAFLKLLTGAETVSEADADKVMNLTIYDFLEEYAGDIYKNLLVGPLNNDVKTMLVENIKPLDDEYNNILDAVFNWDYEFKEDTFDEFLGAGKGNLVDQLNNVIIKLLEVILTKDAYNALGLKKGGNENIEENLAKAFRFVLPKLGELKNLGADLSGFTADKVKNMTAEEMAVGVLKLFFEGWFKNEDMAEVNKATTLEQLAVLAAKYAVTYDEWVPMDIAAAKNIKNVEKMTDEACIDLLFEIGMETAAKALAYNKSTTYYELPADTSKWTAEDYLDDIVDWGLNFVDGLPASADILSTERDKLDGEGGFYKLNVILDSLFDLSFISGCGNGTFSFDMETMLLDTFLPSLLDLDVDNAVKMLAENEESELFNKKINQAAIDLVDDLLTGLFEEGYVAPTPSKFVLGDVDENGEVKAADARLALRASVGLEKLTASQQKAADADKNGEIKAADARLILRASVGLETLK